MLQDNGDSANRIDLVIMGDGYRTEDQDQFRTDATNAMNAYFSATAGHQPFAAYRNYFNVKIVHVVSNQTGADNGSAGGLRDTALGAYFYCGGIDRLLCVNSTAVHNIAMTDAPEYDIILVVVNDSKYGGSGGSIVTASTAPSAINIAVHELGHGFAGLADEYSDATPGYAACNPVSDCVEPNVTLFASNRNAVKWRDWIDGATPIPTPDVAANFGLVGAFEGARYLTSGIYRPAHLCIMRALEQPFCSVCSEATVLGVYHRGVNLVDSAVPGGPVAIGSDGSVDFSITGPRPEPNTLSFAWSVDGNPIATNSTGTLTRTGADFGAGSHVLSVNIHDDTTWVRTDTQNLLTTSHSWTVTTVGTVSGFPTKDSGDGKFVSLTGANLETVQNQHTQFLIGIPAGQTVFNVQVFDGDEAVGSQYDTNDAANLPTSTTRTCYDLYSSVDKVHLDTTAPNVRVDSSTLPDAQWGSIFNGSVFGQASGSGAHFYILDVYMTDGACAGSQAIVPITAGIANVFKVRATGQVSTVSADFSFLARDLSGPFAVGSLSPNTEMPDTTYDGQFSFFIDVGSAAAHMTLRDADADILVDDDPNLVGKRGPDDVKADGVATGRSADIQYEVFDPAGVSRLLNTNPSGNNNGVDVFDAEELVVDVTGNPGSWEWRWTGVHVENNVRIWAPFGSPVTFELFGEPVTRLSPSGAKPRTYWTTTSLHGLLPVTLGTGRNALTVCSSSQAVALLKGTDHSFDSNVCGCQHSSRKTSGEDLRLAASFAGELLATKLNVAQGSRHGENLLGAFVYGQTTSVASVVTDSDSALVTGAHACQLTLDQKSTINSLLVFLRAINDAEISFAVPVPAALGTAGVALPAAQPGVGASRGM